MTTIAELTTQLDALQAQLPKMIADNPDPGDFWCEFAGQADLIEDQAGEHTALVARRIAGMLAEHGRYVASVEVDDA
ncbi:MAG: hypothetical protein ACRER5_08295 [Pseudomonas sp.]